MNFIHVFASDEVRHQYLTEDAEYIVFGDGLTLGDLAKEVYIEINEPDREIPPGVSVHHIQGKVLVVINKDNT